MPARLCATSSQPFLYSSQGQKRDREKEKTGKKFDGDIARWATIRRKLPGRVEANLLPLKVMAGQVPARKTVLLLGQMM